MPCFSTFARQGRMWMHQQSNLESFPVVLLPSFLQHVYQYCYKTATCVSFIYDYEVGMEEFERCAKYVVRTAMCVHFPHSCLCAYLEVLWISAFFRQVVPDDKFKGNQKPQRCRWCCWSPTWIRCCHYILTITLYWLVRGSFTIFVPSRPLCNFAARRR